MTEIRPDWREYFRRFNAEHGENPVQLEDDTLLLWPDGWRYSALSYAGPEYPPPKDPVQLQQLQLLYWTLRERQLQDMITSLQAKYDGLIALQQDRQVSIPLIRLTTEYDLEKGRFQLVEHTVLLDDIRQQLENLKLQHEEAFRNVKNLSRSNTN